MENYELICQIGKGNFGSISKIIRKSDQKVLVWKELDYGQMSEKEKQQIVSEVNILRELKHQNIVRYYDRILDKKHAKIYIIMEYCEGGDLGQLIKRFKKNIDYISEDVICKIFTQIVLALHLCHTRKEGKVLHRDIKPSNVFLDKDNNVKLGDFGLSRVLSNESNFAYSHVGTPYYMSPEQIDEMRYNEKSDIWSLGCFLYEMTTFCPPFEAKNHVMLAMRIKSGKIEKINSRYSEELWRVISWMLNVNQEQRPSVEDLLNVPQVCIRLREKRIKENMAKIKSYEEALKIREDEINKRESKLDEREKELKEKEEMLNEKERSLNELSKRVSSMSSTNAGSFSYNNNNTNMNQHSVLNQTNNTNSDIGNLISYGNNNTNNIGISSTTVNMTSSDDFGFLTNNNLHMNNNNNISTKISTTNFPCEDLNNNVTTTQNITSKSQNIIYTNNPDTTTSQNNLYCSTTLLHQQQLPHNLNPNNISHKTFHQNNSLHQKSYDNIPFEHPSNLKSTTNVSTSLTKTKIKSLNNSTNINKTHSNFKFDPSIYNDNPIENNPYNTNNNNNNNNINTGYCPSTAKSNKKTFITKRAQTPKITMSANRNYAHYSSNIATTRNSNVQNTPVRNSSSSANYYYTKYINNTQGKNNMKTVNTSNHKSTSSINGVIEHNSNRNGSKSKRMKIPNRYHHSNSTSNVTVNGNRINMNGYNNIY